MQFVPAMESLLLGYLFGNVLFAYIFGKVFRKVDIRQHGNKNPGTLNSIGVLGWPLTFAVLIGDVAKAIIPILIVRRLLGLAPVYGQIAGIGAILGHTFPFWMGFRGGKGTASAIGVLLALDWRIAIPFCIILVAPSFLTNLSVVGSYSAYLSMPLLYALLGHSANETILAAVTAALLIAIQIPLLLRTIRGKQPSIARSVFGRP